MRRPSVWLAVRAAVVELMETGDRDKFSRSMDRIQEAIIVSLLATLERYESRCGG